MTIKNIARHNVITALPEMTTCEAAKLMKEHNIGAVVVIDEENIPIGIVTDRDITMKIVANNVNTAQFSIGELMDEELLILMDYQGISESIELMCSKGIRRAPVIDKDEKIIGIVTIDDIILLLCDEMQSIGRLIRKQLFI